MPMKRGEVVSPEVATIMLAIIPSGNEALLFSVIVDGSTGHASDVLGVLPKGIQDGSITLLQVASTASVQGSILVLLIVDVVADHRIGDLVPLHQCLLIRVPHKVESFMGGMMEGVVEGGQ